MYYAQRLPPDFLCISPFDTVVLKSFVDGLMSVDEGLDLEAFLDGEERPRVDDMGVCVRGEAVVKERFGAVGVGGAVLTERFGAAHCWRETLGDWWDVVPHRAKLLLRKASQRAWRRCIERASREDR